MTPWRKEVRHDKSAFATCDFACIMFIFMNVIEMFVCSKICLNIYTYVHAWTAVKIILITKAQIKF
jgi:hypothetical protein